MSTINQVAQLATFGTLWAVLAAGHNIADHVLGQTDRQAASKGAPSEADVEAGSDPHRGWAACLAHVAAYHVVLGVLIAAAWLVLPLDLSWTGVAAGMLFSAGTHAFLDRRWPVRWILQRTGSPKFAELNTGGLNGMYLADQALHGLALLLSAGLITLA